MSVKHVKAYYDEICNQYMDMIAELHDFEELSMQGMMPPEKFDEIKKSIQPLMDNYQRISYIMFLLNKPNKKTKQSSYLKRIKLNKSDPSIQENNDVLTDLKNKTKIK